MLLLLADLSLDSWTCDPARCLDGHGFPLVDRVMTQGCCPLKGSLYRHISARCCINAAEALWPITLNVQTAAWSRARLLIDNETLPRFWKAWLSADGVIALFNQLAKALAISLSH